MAQVYLVGVMQYIFVFFLFLKVMKENPNLIISVIIKGQEHHKKDKRGKKNPLSALREGSEGSTQLHFYRRTTLKR